MKKIAIAIALIGALGAGAAQAQTTVKVGWCARTISSAGASRRNSNVPVTTIGAISTT